MNKHNKQRNTEIFKCGECEKEFNEEWKLSAHIKTHKKYQCDQQENLPLR